MADKIIPDDADSRTSSVGRKRTLQQSIDSVQEISHSPPSDLNGDQSSNHLHKRNKRNGSGIDISDIIPQETQGSASEEGLNQNIPTGNSEELGASAISWNKGIQPTVRTTLGNNVKTKKKAVSNNKPSTAQKLKEDSNNEPQQHILGDAPAPVIGLAPQKKANPTKTSKAQRRALAALEIATIQPLEATEVDTLDNSKQGGVTNSNIEFIRGINLILPSRCEKQVKEKPAAFIARDLQTNFVPQLLINNSDVLSKMDQNSIFDACEVYISQNYNRQEQKLASKHRKDASFPGFCKNRLKEAQAGMTSVPKQLVSTASSTNGQYEDDSSTKISFVSILAGRDQNYAVLEPNGLTKLSNISKESESRKEESKLSLLNNKRGNSIVTTSMTSEAAAEAMQGSSDGYSPQLETVVVTSIGRASEQSKGVAKTPSGEEMNRQQRYPDQEIVQSSSESEVFLINKYYPGLSQGTLAARCLTCGNDGHTTTSCVQLTCSTCGVHGIHFSNSCPKTIRCSKCRQRGHQKPDCPEKLAVIESEGISCDMCGSGHHTEKSCHFLWRSFKPDVGSRRKVRSLLADCYNCGSDGHFGPECALSRSSLLTGGYTWSMANRDRYIDPTISISRDYLPPRSQNGFSIKGSAKFNPVLVDDSDEENFIRAKIPPPQQKGHIRFAGHQSVEDRNRPQQPPRYPPPIPQKSYHQNVEYPGFRREQSFSPPRYPDYNQERYDGQHHFDRNNDYQSHGRPLSPIRGGSTRHDGSNHSGRGGRKAKNGGRIEKNNVPPPQSLTGKKARRRGRPQGAASRGKK